MTAETDYSLVPDIKDVYYSEQLGKTKIASPSRAKDRFAYSLARWRQPFYLKSKGAGMLIIHYKRSGILSSEFLSCNGTHFMYRYPSGFECGTWEQEEEMQICK